MQRARAQHHYPLLPYQPLVPAGRAEALHRMLAVLGLDALARIVADRFIRLLTDKCRYIS